MALKFSGTPEDATSVLVGMDPSVSSGLAELINDPDQNGAFKVSDKDGQKFVIKMTRDGFVEEAAFDLSGITLAAH